MTKIWNYAAILVLGAATVFAQSATTQTSVGQPTDTNEPVYTGCLSGTHDNYFLITDDGRQFRLHSDKDIKEHVGRRVEVRGTQKREGADRPAKAAASGNAEIDVADLKNVGQSCFGTAAANPSQGQMNNAANATQGQRTGTSSSQGQMSGTTAGAASTTSTNTAASGGTTGTTVATAGSSAPNSTGANAGATASPADTSAANTQTTDLGDTDQPLFKGCVTGTHNKYTLKADNGDSYRLHSDKDINEHVGDRVEIRGTLKPEGASKAKANSGWKGELDVADIKSVGSCK